MTTAGALELGEHVATVYAPHCALCGQPVCCQRARHHQHTDPGQCMTASREVATIALAAHRAADHGDDVVDAYWRIVVTVGVSG